MPGFTVATVNDDWATPHKTNIPRAARHADLLLVQEAKHVTGRPVPKHWGWIHHTRDQGRAGCAIAWDKHVLTRHTRHGRRKTGMRIAVTPHGVKMLTRWLLWVNLETGGHKVHVAAVHRPPPRYRRLWPLFDAAVAAWVHSRRKRGWEVLIGLDANQHDPQPLRRLTGLSWHHRGIDGFLASDGLRLRHVHTLAKGSSDHHPVLAHVSFKEDR